jgi:sterol desaturase/sphingolipid hydroxylase (fatty acid hydroxylase superfamily)
VNTVVVLTAFIVLGVSTWCREAARAALVRRDWGEWILDGSGLVVQGVAIPLAQTGVLYLLLSQLLPALKGRLVLAPWVGFLLNFVLVDYAYYWNHRLLHSSTLWRWHVVHHTAPAMDLVVTARNTLWSHFLILYVWVNTLGIFALRDPRGFVLAMGLTAALDLWRHSDLAVAPESRTGRILAWVLITPHEHAWHHSTERPRCNFGANLSWFDRLHGTYVRPDRGPARLGLPLGWTTFERLVCPGRVL